MYKTINENISSEIVEKKSKFIANIFYIQTVEEAENKLEEIRKKYYDARHNCYAFSIMTKDGIINRSSDDGEPSGTAGAPILNILNKNEIINVLVVVTRYFGGILLGTGGLVKAYSQAVIEALNNTNFVIEELGEELELEIDYNDLEKLNYYCNQNNLKIVNNIYEEKIKCIIEVNSVEKNKIIDNINELNFKIINYKTIKEKNIRKNIEK